MFQRVRDAIVFVKHYHRKSKYTCGVKECGVHEGEKVAIISPPNTCTHPGTVMIEAIDTIIAYWAVFRPRRPIYIACTAPSIHHLVFDENNLRIGINRV